MKILMPHEVYQKIMFWVQKADFEVSGMGNASFDPKTGVFQIHDACLIKQEGTGGTTDIEPEALAKAMYDLRDAPGQMSFWWHSHVDMSVFMSGTDVATCKELGKNGWCLAMVFNRKYQYKTALAYVKREISPLFGQETKNEIAYKEDFPMQVTVPVMDTDRLIALNQQFDANVKRKVYQPVHHYVGSGWRASDFKTDFEKKHDTFYDRWRSEYDRGATQLLYAEWMDSIYESDKEGDISKNFVKKSKKKAQADAMARAKTLTTSGSSKTSGTAGSKVVRLVDTDQKQLSWKDDVPTLERGQGNDASRFDAQVIHNMEAAALGVTPEQYSKMLDTATITELEELDEKLNRYFSDKHGLDRDDRPAHGVRCFP